MIRGTNLDGKACNFIDDGFVFVSERKADELVRNLAFPGDIVFTQRGTLGQVAEIPETARFPRYVISQSQMKLTVDPSKALPRFVYHWYRSPVAQAHLEKHTLATGVPHINLGILKAFPVPLPPLPTQQRVVALLDKADAIRRKRQEAIALTEQLLRSTFLEMFGDPVTNPKRWPTKPLGELATFTGGGTPSRSVPEYFTGDTCWATSKDMKGEVLTDTEEHITEAAIKNSATKLVQPGTILVVVKSKILMHRLPVLVASVPTCFGQDLKGISPHDRGMTYYVARHMRIGQESLLRRARGVNTEGLTLEHLAEYAVMLPPREMLAHYVNIENATAKALGNLGDARQQADTLFQSLVQRAFSGQL